MALLTCAGLIDNIEMNSGDVKYGVKTVVRCREFVDITKNLWTQYGQDILSCDIGREKARTRQRKKDRKKERAYMYVCLDV